MTKKYQGVIFDFNGTLFWDTKLHNRAWDIFLEEYALRITDQEKNEIIHGKNNQDILNALFKRELDRQTLDNLIYHKESIYQNICLESDLGFAPGALDFIAFLNNLKVKYGIATASGLQNVDFYCAFLKLENWFSRDYIIYNDGTIKGKPNPDIFLRAMAALEMNPAEVVIFEDSKSGIQAAERSGAGKIIIVNSNGDDYYNFSHEIITDFNQVNRALFQ